MVSQRIWLKGSFHQNTKQKSLGFRIILIAGERLRYWDCICCIGLYFSEEQETWEKTQDKSSVLLRHLLSHWDCTDIIFVNKQQNLENWQALLLQFSSVLHMRTLFDSTKSQESKSEVCAHEFYAAMRIKIKTHLGSTLYLSFLWSDLSCAAELVIADSKLVELVSRHWRSYKG